MLVHDVVVVGAGGMGREAAAWVADCAEDAGWNLLGFLDDHAQTHGTQVADLEVLGPLTWLEGRTGVNVVVAIGNSADRERVTDLAIALHAGLPSIAHPSAHIGPRCTLGAGVIVGPNTTLTCDITVGAGAILNFGCAIGHDGDIGRFAFIGPGAQLGGEVTVGEHAQVGIGASVIQGRAIGDRAAVGAGAAVIDDVPAGMTVGGVPARPLAK